MVRVKGIAAGHDEHEHITDAARPGRGAGRGRTRRGGGGRAGNRTRGLADPTAHAEMLVIREACHALGEQRLEGASLYVTLEPCPMCAAAISLARIHRLYWGASDAKGGGVEHGPRIFSQPTCHHAPELYGGLCATEAAELLVSFFADRR